MVARLLVLAAGLLFSGIANAWFFFWIPLPGNKAFDTDPDSIVVSPSDRTLGQCAGLHLNQAQKGMSSGTFVDRYPGAPPPEPPTQTPESKFHSDMADMALERALEKDKVKSLAEAISVRWGRVGSADQKAGRQYSIALIRACNSVDIPWRYSDFQQWQAGQDEKKRLREEAERKRIQEERAKATPAAAQLVGSVDFMAEARKSAQALGCMAAEVQLAGAEQSELLFVARCSNGGQLTMKCVTSPFSCAPRSR